MMGQYTLTRLQLLVAVTLLSASTLVYADMSECSNKKTLDDRNYCMASYSGSATFCDRLSNYERRTDCYSMVVRKQRNNRNR